MTFPAASPVSPPPSRRQQRKDEIRARIMAAGLDVFGRKGFEAATVEDLLQAAGVSRATFYAQFAGKPDVARALATDIWQRATLLYADFSTLADLSFDSIRDWLRSVFLVWQSHREGMGTMLRELFTDIAAESAARHEGLITSLIGDGRHWQGFSEAEARRRAYLMVFQLERTMQAYYLEGWEQDADALLDTLADIWVKSLAP